MRLLNGNGSVSDSVQYLPASIRLCSIASELYRRQTHLSAFDVRGVHALHRFGYERLQPAHEFDHACRAGYLFFKCHDTFLTSLLRANEVIFSCSAKHCASQKISPVCGALTYSFLIFREHKAQVVSVRGARSLTKTNLI